ncbi:glycosyltransferase [Bacillus sp. JJ664]
MNEYIDNHLSKLGELKKNSKILLSNLNSEYKGISFNFFEQFIFNADDFSTEKNITIDKNDTGIHFNSTLKNEEFKYIFCKNTNKIESMVDFLISNNNRCIKTIGIVEGKCEVELNIIAIYKDGVRYVSKARYDKVIDLKNIDLENIDHIKLAIRIRGKGKFILQSITFLAEKPSLKLYKFDEKKSSKKIKDLNVAFIADEFTTRCFEPEFNIIKISPENWNDELVQNKPDLFFCESAWLGNDGSWTNKVGTGGPRDNTELTNVVHWCKENNIPTIFWNKEDPFHFDAFINTAIHFDYVFTTDQNSIELYKQQGVNNVFTFPFAAQPKYHNPIERFERKEKVVFAGAYYGDKFPERTKAMDNMISISGDYGIDIYDRNYKNPESPNQFPEVFKKFIVGTLKGDEIDYAYKGYKIALNVNSIINSPTMFARRVFELLASNTPVVSSESQGINNMFGELVVASSNYDELKNRISRYFTDDHYFYTNRLLSLRHVMENHTYKNRIEKMLNDIGFSYTNNDDGATMIGIVRSKEELKAIMGIFNKQTLENKKLVILLDIFEGYIDIFNNYNNGQIKTFLIDYIHHYSNIGQIIETSHAAPIHFEHHYGENYLKDLFITTNYIDDANIVKGQGQPYTFVTNGLFNSSLISKKSLKLINPSMFINNIENDSDFSNWFKYGMTFFNIDDFNFLSRQNSLPREKINEINI